MAENLERRRTIPWPKPLTRKIISGNNERFQKKHKKVLTRLTETFTMDSIRKVINENLLESSRLVEVGSGHL